MSAEAEAKRLEEEATQQARDHEKIIAFAGGVSRYANQTKGHIVDFPDPPMMSTRWGKDEIELFTQMLAEWASDFLPVQDDQE